MFFTLCSSLDGNFRDPLQFVSNRYEGRNSHGHVTLTMMFLQPSALIRPVCIGRNLHWSSVEVLNAWKQK
jgi:hypothetical protein